MPVLIAAVALLGLAIGSFLNVVICRVPLELSLSRPASRCPACEQPIRRRHNVPVFGWLILRGRCADCQEPISVRYPLVELLCAILFIAVTWQLARLQLIPALPAYLIFVAAGLALSMIDLDVHRLPNAIILPAYPVLALALTIAAVVLDDPASLLRSVICGLALYGCYYVLAYCYPAGMGYGDVKLAGVIGGMLGFLSYQALLVGAFAAFVIGGAVGVALLLSRRGSRKTHVPFGPFMIAGALLALFATTPISDLYSQLLLTT